MPVRSLDDRRTLFLTWRLIGCSACLACLLFLSPARESNADETGHVSFVNDVVPLLTKAGCNAGVCHAKAGGGQNGFQLSLLGFEPAEDYDHLVREGRGRRLFPAAPRQSLLLRKASGSVPHRGGVRLPVDSEGYALLLKWVQQGTPFQTSDRLGARVH